jgi:hypothetical protein
MKWQWSLLLPTLFAAPALAQQPQPLAATTPPGPVIDAAEPPACPTALFNCPPGSGGDRLSGNHNFVNFINWMSNPLQNIDPRAVTAIYPIFLNEWVSNTPPIPNGDFQVYAPAVTIALSERFAIGLCQGGYAAAEFSRNPIDSQRLMALDPAGRFRDVEVGGDRQGWLNLGGFLQYTLVEDVENQFLLTGGLRWEAPCGSHDVFQGHGPAHLAPYFTAGQEFGKFHILATTGYQFPAGPGDDNTQLFYANVHFDRQVFGWLYPLVEFNSIYHTTSVNFGLLTRRGFIDMGNFEATGNIVSLAAGANAVIIPERLEFGAVYTTVIASQRNFDANGLIVKMTYRY